MSFKSYRQHPSPRHIIDAPLLSIFSDSLCTNPGLKGQYNLALGNAQGKGNTQKTVRVSPMNKTNNLFRTEWYCFYRPKNSKFPFRPNKEILSVKRYRADDSSPRYQTQGVAVRLSAHTEALG